MGWFSRSDAVVNGIKRSVAVPFSIHTTVHRIPILTFKCDFAVGVFRSCLCIGLFILVLIIKLVAMLIIASGVGVNNVALVSCMVYSLQAERNDQSQFRKPLTMLYAATFLYALCPPISPSWQSSALLFNLLPRLVGFGASTSKSFPG